MVNGDDEEAMKPADRKHTRPPKTSHVSPPRATRSCRLEHHYCLRPNGGKEGEDATDCWRGRMNKVHVRLP